MGSNGTAFTRNVNPKRIKPEKPPRLFDPSPRKVSLDLMTRDEFKPAVNLNVLAMAWIQFENHNWFFHGRGKEDEIMDVPVEDNDDWPEHPMRVRRTVSVPAHSSGAGANETNGSGIDFGNTETHWWDGSQIYGSSKETPGRAAHVQGRQAQDRAPTGACRADPDELGHRHDRLQRELVVRAVLPAHAVHQGAQRDLRRAQA